MRATRREPEREPAQPGSDSLCQLRPGCAGVPHPPPKAPGVTAVRRVPSPPSGRGGGPRGRARSRGGLRTAARLPPEVALHVLSLQHDRHAALRAGSACASAWSCSTWTASIALRGEAAVHCAADRREGVAGDRQRRIRQGRTREGGRDRSRPGGPRWGSRQEPGRRPPQPDRNGEGSTGADEGKARAPVPASACKV